MSILWTPTMSFGLPCVSFIISMSVRHTILSPYLSRTLGTMVKETMPVSEGNPTLDGKGVKSDGLEDSRTSVCKSLPFWMAANIVSCSSDGFPTRPNILNGGDVEGLGLRVHVDGGDMFIVVCLQDGHTLIDGHVGVCYGGKHVTHVHRRRLRPMDLEFLLLNDVNICIDAKPQHLRHKEK